eukprot:gene38125-51489_t
MARAWIPAIGSGAFVCWIRVGGLTSEYGLISLGRIPLRGVLVRTHSRRGVAQGLFSLTTALGNFGPVIVGRFFVRSRCVGRGRCHRQAIHKKFVGYGARVFCIYAFNPVFFLLRVDFEGFHKTPSHLHRLY